MNKTFIAFDTNIWIYLITKSDYHPFFDEIRNKQQSGEIVLLTNEIIKKEWERNKPSTKKSAVDSILAESKSARRIANFIPDQEDKEKFLKLLDTYKDEPTRIAAAEKRISMVDEMIDHCIDVVVTDEQKLYVANLAIDAKPPFLNKKNNFNDALIVRNLCQYVSSQIYMMGDATPLKYDFIFVSNNPDDFIDQTTKSIYTSITDGIDANYRIINVTNLAQALNMSEELIDGFDAWYDKHIDEMIESYIDNEAQRQLDK